MRLSPLLPIAAVVWLGTLASAQRPDAFVESRDHPAILYTSAPAEDAVALLNRRLRDGTAELRFDPDNGYLRSVLEALDVPVASQTLVFSPTSFQASLITMRNPRALYFNDAVAIGWVRGAGMLEVAAHDPRQGVILYELPQTPAARPQFTRNAECLQCHLTWDTKGVPGFTMVSTAPRPDENAYAFGFTTDHRSPLRERWGGWYVTGTPGAGHMGNVPVAPAELRRSTVPAGTRRLDSVGGLFDLKGFLSPHSDVVALLLLGHQAHAANLITRLGWETRVADAGGGGGAVRVRDAVNELVDYFLMVDEAPLAAVRGSSDFAAQFAARGPSDPQGRSLRQLDLQRRLLRYRCSYMIYSPAFDALPPRAREAVYARMWQILSGEDRDPRYRSFTRADRQAVVEILRATKTGVPAAFSGAVR